ncbi:hypothetical protein GO986_16305 [Deinococcus sp. HMF7620]|uniref:Uncharacterized protein n=1 Tax=Deinococcus arboris TaxID=2682977 RepID=A0A7C9HT48_9DEIO|nr:hypothetical protein [Deinococcus arboris]MVN88309.1 hypothetical protein [Deinococcus arboris]
MPLDPILYPPPQVRPGDWLDDELLGRVQVGGYHDGPIPWPYRRRTGAHSLILTPALVRAVRTETAGDVQEAFGVSEGTVWGWRKALGVTRDNNPATKAAYAATRNIPPEAAARGRQHALSPEARQKALESIKAGWQDRQPHPETITWTAKMDALLGTLPDEQAAQALGVSKTKVAQRRRLLGKPAWREGHTVTWTPEMETRLGTAFDGVLATEWGISRSAVTLRRQALGIAPLSRP